MISHFVQALLIALLPQAAAPQQGPVTSPAPATPTAGTPAASPEQAVMRGEQIDPRHISAGVVETLEQMMERERLHPGPTEGNRKARNGASGVWIVPSRGAIEHPHSGTHYATNKWGDTSMGISFGRAVDLDGAWFAGQSSSGSWTSGLQAVGYADGSEVSRTAWFEEIGEEPAWFPMGLENIDRVVLLARPVQGGAGWYAMDDLTFSPAGAESAPLVIDFEDCGYRKKLTGSGHGGLTWETGTGDFKQEIRAIHPPQVPPGLLEEGTVGGGQVNATYGGGGTLPNMGQSFTSTKLGDTGANAVPPDTCGTVGPDHFVLVVNSNISIYQKSDGTRISSMSLTSFLGSGVGDPRAVFDPDSQRYIVMATNFSNRLYFAVSTTDDATGSWYKFNVNITQGSDSGTWPDYPTLGVDADGVYSAAYMVGNSSMSIFAIDKAPLVAASPSTGTMTAFRSLNYDGAIQPVVTHGYPGGEYLISRKNSSQLRLRFLTGPMTAPTLNLLGSISIQTHSDPPDAPAQGSNTALDTVGTRLMNAVYRNGSIWTAHCVGVSGRAASRWYEVNAAGMSVTQYGTVQDSTLHYFFPTITANAAGDAIMGFTASSANMYASAYYTGRAASDPSGQMAPPASSKDGVGAYNNTDSYGRNRWGDYSLCSVDPVDDLTMWTVQEYARPNNNWGTWVTELAYDAPCGTSNYCVTTANSIGSGAIISSGGSTSVAANDMVLIAYGLPLSQPGIFFYGPNQTQIPYGNGNLCAGGGINRLPVVFSSSWGDTYYNLDITSPPQASGQILDGSTWNFQFWYRDPNGGGAFYNFTDGLSATFCP